MDQIWRKPIDFRCEPLLSFAWFLSAPLSLSAFGLFLQADMTKALLGSIDHGLRRADLGKLRHQCSTIPDNGALDPGAETVVAPAIQETTNDLSDSTSFEIGPV